MLMIPACFVLIEQLLEEYRFNGFPVIADQQSQMLSGFVTRRDMKVAIRKCCCSSSLIMLFVLFVLD